MAEFLWGVPVQFVLNGFKKPFTIEGKPIKNSCVEVLPTKLVTCMLKRGRGHLMLAKKAHLKVFFTCTLTFIKKVCGLKQQSNYELTKNKKFLAA